MSVFLKRSAKVILLLPSVFVLLYLFYLNLFSTTMVATNYETNEKVLYFGDQPFRHILFIFLAICFSGFFIFLSKHWNKTWTWILLAVYVFLGISWVMITQCLPEADMKAILEAADQIRQGNYQAFNQGGYLSLYRNQWGIVYLMSWLSRVIGLNNYLFYQIMNVFFAGIACASLYGIGASFWDREKERLSALVLVYLILFFPLFFYITLVYGTVPGMGLSLLGVLCLTRFFKSGKIWYGIIMAFSVSLACIIKQNYLIVLIAVVLFLFLDLLTKKRIKSCVLILCVLLLYFGADHGIESYFESIGNINADEDTMPAEAWIAMGLTDGLRAPGWYNAFSYELFVEAEYDTGKASELAFESIQNSISGFLDDPSYALAFFSKKIASQWAEPTYQAFWRMTVDNDYSIEISPLIALVIYGPGYDFFFYFLNQFQNVIYFGVIAFIFFRIKKVEPEELLLLCIFLGGFLFHLFWEGKAAYTMMYFACLIPYAAVGNYEIYKKGKELFFNVFSILRNRSFSKEKVQMKKLFSFLGFITGFFLLGAVICVEQRFNSIEWIVFYQDDEAFLENRKMMDEIAEGLQDVE